MQIDRMKSTREEKEDVIICVASFRDYFNLIVGVI